MNTQSQWFTRKNCRLCGEQNLVKVLSFPSTPPANQFVGSEKLGEHQNVFPLDVWLCESCGHAQLVDVVDPDILFKDYVYVSGTSKVFVEHFRKYAESVVSYYNIKKGSRVLDIGSNDGTLLRHFKNQGMEVLGIDPALKISQEASRSGIPTLTGFFSTSVAKEIKTTHGEFHVITANNVLAHIADLEEVNSGVEILLCDGGILVFEVSYLDDVISKNLFDTIYHEHLDYHSITPLLGFLERNNMSIIDAERVSSHGGSIRIYARKSIADKRMTSRLVELLEIEQTKKLMSKSTFDHYSNSIQALCEDLTQLLASLKAQGKRIAGYGAPAKATTLMYRMGLSSSTIEYIVDDSPLKQNLFSPGLHIPIVSSQILCDDPPDYLLILAWNFADSIISANENFKKSGGKFIIPVPKVEIRG